MIYFFFVFLKEIFKMDVVFSVYFHSLYRLGMWPEHPLLSVLLSCIVSFIGDACDGGRREGLVYLVCLLFL